MDYTVPCECEAAGHCERFQRDMPQGMHDVCQGRSTSEAVRKAYLEQWGRQAEQKHQAATLRDKAINLAQAGAAFAEDGGAVVSWSEYHERLERCGQSGPVAGTACQQLRYGQCAACGCLVQAKAWSRSQTCPLGLWPLPEAVEAG